MRFTTTSSFAVSRCVLTAAACCALGATVGAQDGLRAYDMSGERRTTGRLFHDGESFPGSFVLTWSAPVWRERYTEMVEASGATGPLRLGANAWTSFDTSVPMMFGETRVWPGQYYLAIARDENDELQLLFYDAARARHTTTMPFQPDPEASALRVPLTLERGDGLVERMDFRFTLADDAKTHGRFELRWGPFTAATSWRATLRGRLSARAGLEHTVEHMIALLDAGRHRELIETYMPAPELTQGAIIKRVLGQQRFAEALLVGLRGLGQDMPDVDETTEAVKIDTGSSVSGFQLVREGDVWNLRGGGASPAKMLREQMRRRRDAEQSGELDAEERAEIERRRKMREMKRKEAERRRREREQDAEPESRRTGGG